MFESNLLSQIDVRTPLPSFVEVHLVRTLNNSMHDAFVFAHTLIADHAVRARVWLPYSSEIFYVLWGMLEWRLLRDMDASFAETLFNLRRVHLAPVPAGREVSSAPLSFRHMTWRSKVLSWISLIVFPYVRRLLRKKYDQLTAGTPDAEMERQVMERRYGRLGKWTNWLLQNLYPYLHVVIEGSPLVFLVAFLLGKTPYQSLWDCMNRLVLRRRTMIDATSLGKGAKSTMVVAEIILMSILLGFRLLAWRDGVGRVVRSSTDTTGGSDTRRIPRPDVEAALNAPNVPQVNPGVCPVCKKGVTNPAVNTVSGIVCCYPCLQGFITDNHKCPVTGLHCILPNIRRLYEA